MAKMRLRIDSKTGEVSRSCLLRAFCCRTQERERSPVTSSSQRYGSSDGGLCCELEPELGCTWAVLGAELMPAPDCDSAARNVVLAVPVTKARRARISCLGK